MKNWIKCKLNEVCIIGDGNHSSNYPKSSEMVSDGIPFIFPIAFLPLNDFAAPYQLGDKIKVEILGISRGYYDFLALAQEQLQNGGLFAPPPVNVRSNFTKNRPEAMNPTGYFNVCELKSLEIEIVE